MIGWKDTRDTHHSVQVVLLDDQVGPELEEDANLIDVINIKNFRLLQNRDIERLLASFTR